jgi:hypothetical protein
MLAAFTDGRTGDPSSRFSASIRWEDQTISQATITGSKGKYTVTVPSPGHTFKKAGTYKIPVTISEGAATSGPSVTRVTVTVVVK